MFDLYIKKRNSSGKYLTRSQACVNDLQYSIQSLRNLFSCLSNRNPIFSCDADQDYCCRSNLQKKSLYSSHGYAILYNAGRGGTDMSLKKPWMIRKKWKEFVSEKIKN